MKTSVRAFVAVVILGLVCAHAHGGVLCRKEGIPGYEREYSLALSPIGKDKTKNVNESKLYFSKKGDSIYIQTNYIPDGEQHPAIIVIDKSDQERIGTIRLEEMKALIGLPKQPPDIRGDKPSRDYRPVSQVYLERDLFDDEGRSFVELSGADEVFVVREDAEPIKARRVASDAGDFWVIEGSRGIEFPARSNPREVFRRLENTPLGKEGFTIVSLLDDVDAKDFSKIMEERGGKVLPKVNLLADRKITGSSLELDRMLALDCYNTIIVLRNVQKEPPSAHEPEETENFRVSSAGLHLRAKALGLDLVEITYATPPGLDGPSGGSAAFSSEEVVQLLNRAMQAKNYWQFVDLLVSAPNLSFQVDTKSIDSPKKMSIAPDLAMSSQGGLAINMSLYRSYPQVNRDKGQVPAQFAPTRGLVGEAEITYERLHRYPSSSEWYAWDLYAEGILSVETDEYKKVFGPECFLKLLDEAKSDPLLLVYTFQLIDQGKSDREFAHAIAELLRMPQYAAIREIRMNLLVRQEKVPNNDPLISILGREIYENKRKDEEEAKRERTKLQAELDSLRKVEKAKQDQFIKDTEKAREIMIEYQKGVEIRSRERGEAKGGKRHR